MCVCVNLSPSLPLETHPHTPQVALALARVSDEDMQLRALRMLRLLCLTGFNKFNMQKSFSVIHDLVPFLGRSDVRQQVVSDARTYVSVMMPLYRP